VARVGDPWSTLHEKPHSLAAVLKKLREES
jgi:hypothetical protein